MAGGTETRVVLAGFYPPPFGGESVHVRELSARLRAAGILKRVVNLRRGAPPSLDYVNGAGPLRLSFTLMRLLSEGTLLHLHTNGHSWKSWMMVICAALVLRVRRAAGVLTLHSGMSPRFLAGLGPVGVKILRSGLFSFAHIVCVNEEIRRAMAGLGVPDERFIVVPAFLGATPGALGGQDERVFSGFRPLISVVAGKGPEYGLPVLIQALPRLKSHYSEIGCVILGHDGAAGPADYVRELGLSERVRFIGPLPHERCLAFVARSDLFVRPSLADGDAVSVREALSLGVSVVASDTGSRPAGTTLFRIGDSADLAEKAITRLQMGRTSQRASNALDFGDAILSVYRKVVQAGI